jgi:hypothetical protein
VFLFGQVFRSGCSVHAGYGNNHRACQAPLKILVHNKTARKLIRDGNLKLHAKQGLRLKYNALWTLPFELVFTNKNHIDKHLHVRGVSMYMSIDVVLVCLVK